MNIGFIGAGKVGYTLGKYFMTNSREGKARTLDVKGYYSRSVKSAKDAAAFTDSKAYESIEELINESDIIFMTVPDGSIRQTWKQVKECNIKGKTICHCSGAMSSEDAFEGIEETGALGYSIHPLFAVSDKYNAYKELTGVFFTLEGADYLNEGGSCSRQGQSDREKHAGQGYSGHNREFIELCDAFEKMGNPIRMISGKDKTTYHCAAAIASNLVCGLIDQSLALMQRCGFEEEEAVKALAPILIGNMTHIAEKGPTASLTGPIERNDASTVKKHLECLNDEREKILYSILSRRLIGMAQNRHPDRNYEQMKTLLENSILKYK